MVTKQDVLQKLARNEPLFTSWPKRNRQGIIGTEQEYGGIKPRLRDLPGFLINGGLIYPDMGHIEYCTPECQEITRVVGYDKAGEQLARPFAERLFKHVISQGNDEDLLEMHEATFGAHESYSTCAPRTSWITMLPFFITRQLITGSGYLNQEGGYEFSQRAHKIEHPFSSDTTSNRGILNMRNEPLAHHPLDRFHYIGGESNLCEVALFMKLGLTRAVLDLAEDGLLPCYTQDLTKSVRDLHKVSREGVTTPLTSLTPQRNAFEVLTSYIRAIHSNYKGRDEETDTLIILAEDTLEKLGGNHEGLERRLDWALKKWILSLHTPELKQTRADIDLAYHDCNPETGLYTFLKKSKQVERILSNRLLQACMMHPPSNTRAHARGKIVQIMQGKKECVQSHCWDEIRIVKRAITPKERQEEYMYGRLQEEPSRIDDFSDPFYTYPELIAHYKG